MSSPSAWEDALVALEQWVHQVEAALLSPEPAVLPAVPETPEGAVPGALTLRAVAVHTAMTAALHAGGEQRQRLLQEAAYVSGGPTA